MNENFTIHLVSNVSPATFPENKPSKFSTLLANEIDLSGNQWEVGVTQVMYPSQLGIAKETDKISVYDTVVDSYKNVVGIPDPGSHIYKFPALSIGVERPPMDVLNKGRKLSARINKDNPIVKHMLHEVNYSSNNNLYHNFMKLEFNDKSKKFILHIYRPNVVVNITKHLMKYLGFTKEYYFGRTTHWATRTFKTRDTLPKNVVVYFNVYDITLLHSESYNLVRQNDQMHIHEITAPLHDGGLYVPGDTFTLTINTTEGSMETRIMPVHGNTRIPGAMFIEFDKATRTALDLQHYYPYEELPGLKCKKLKLEEAQKLKTISIQIYYSMFRPLKDFQFIPKEQIGIDIPVETLTNPIQLLAALNTNSKKYAFSFSYDESSSRYEVKTGSKYSIQISPNLATFLGFDNNNKIIVCNSKTKALNVPILHNNITNFFVYSNIVDPVYVGNVKAPLLLVCAFKKDKTQVVQQQEFLNPCYTNINRLKLNQIDIGIYTDTGVLLPFITGTTQLSLHFRKIN